MFRVPPHRKDDVRGFVDTRTAGRAGRSGDTSPVQREKERIGVHPFHNRMRDAGVALSRWQRSAGEKDTVEGAKGGEVQFKVEKAGVIHAGVGKVSFDEAKLAQNIRAFVDAVSRAKPAGAKGTYLKKVSLSSTMGPGVSVDIASATQA